MRKFFLVSIIILIFPLNVSAEKYVCSYLYNNEPRSVMFERELNNKFKQISHSGKQSILEIILENNVFLILGELYKYKFQNKVFYAYNTKFIDKTINAYQSYSITEPKYKEIKSNLNSGNCIYTE